MKENKVAVIDFTKFDIQQLPELQGKKEEIKKVIKENPVVKVTDNASYELAKKSRTAVKTLRTSLEKEKKEVNDRIKKSVLEVVANEYDSLISDVKSDENARQEEVSAWEEKKEQERLEKLRLEQERLDGIKKSIGEFRQYWEGKFLLLTFEGIESLSVNFKSVLNQHDRSVYQEFEVLFDDAVSHLTALLNARVETLTEQENIRLAKIELEKEQERQRLEAERIANEQKIERERIEAEQKRVAEEQRIAQENFLKEKREFEEKQLKLRTEIRIKQLTNLGFLFAFEHGYLFDDIQVSDSQIKEFTDEQWATSIEYISNKVGEKIKNSKSISTNKEMTAEEILTSYGEASESANEDYHEADVDPKGVKTETPIVFDALTEETWESIWTNWHINFHGMTFLEFLKERYNVPTQKDE